jgi:hypothetical protein
MGANAWEGIGKELKIKRKFYVSSRNVRIACPRLMFLLPCMLLASQVCIHFGGHSVHAGWLHARDYHTPYGQGLTNSAPYLGTVLDVVPLLEAQVA